MRRKWYKSISQAAKNAIFLTWMTWMGTRPLKPRPRPDFSTSETVSRPSRRNRDHVIDVVNDDSISVYITERESLDIRLFGEVMS